MGEKIWLRNITCLDHASIDSRGFVVGGSCNVSVILDGEVVGDEAVVIDFSKAKKACKAAIDDKLTGYDHKLILYPESQVEVHHIKSHTLQLSTPEAEIICPEDAVAIVTTTLEAELERIIDTALEKEFPLARVSSKVILSRKGFTEHVASYFTYVHGLKCSSSFGCQNMNHGHRSFVEVQGKDAMVISYEIAQHLNRTVFVSRENITFEDGTRLGIGYNTERGYFRTLYSKNHKIVVLDTETTAEFLVEYVRNMFPQYMVPGITILISEGLMKGAVVNE